MWNESFEFLLGKCQRTKSHGTMGVGVGVGGTAAMKNKELVTFSLFFSLVFSFAFLHHIDVG